MRGVAHRANEVVRLRHLGDVDRSHMAQTPALVRRAGYPGTSVIPATSYLLSLLALKLTTRRVSHVDDLAADPAAALFAGLSTLPKATALTTYYRLHHGTQTALLAALGEPGCGRVSLEARRRACDEF